MTLQPPRIRGAGRARAAALLPAAARCVPFLPRSPRRRPYSVAPPLAVQTPHDPRRPAKNSNPAAEDGEEPRADPGLADQIRSLFAFPDGFKATAARARPGRSSAPLQLCTLVFFKNIILPCAISTANQFCTRVWRFYMGAQGA